MYSDFEHNNIAKLVEHTRLFVTVDWYVKDGKKLSKPTRENLPYYKFRQLKTMLNIASSQAIENDVA